MTMIHGGKRKGAGRPKGGVNAIKKELRDLCMDQVPLVLKELKRLALTADNETTRVIAIKEILDRAYGRAPQALTNADGSNLEMQQFFVSIMQEPAEIQPVIVLDNAG